MSKSSWTRAEVIAAIGIFVAIVGIVLSLTQPEFRRFLGWEQTASTPIAQSTQVSTSTVNATVTAPSNTVPSGSKEPLTPTEVQHWCYTIPHGGNCDISRFVQFRRANGTVLPYAVQMLTGEPIGIKLPAGFTADIWDCNQENIFSGPLDLKKVCTMKVASGPQASD